jgi:hypothetical protein
MLIRAATPARRLNACGLVWLRHWRAAAVLLLCCAAAVLLLCCVVIMPYTASHVLLTPAGWLKVCGMAVAEALTCCCCCCCHLMLLNILSAGAADSCWPAEGVWAGCC